MFRLTHSWSLARNEHCGWPLSKLDKLFSNIFHIPMQDRKCHKYIMLIPGDIKIYFYVLHNIWFRRPQHLWNYPTGLWVYIHTYLIGIGICNVRKQVICSSAASFESSVCTHSSLNLATEALLKRIEGERMLSAVYVKIHWITDKKRYGGRWFWCIFG